MIMMNGEYEIIWREAVAAWSKERLEKPRKSVTIAGP
jgi:hypothetical protein